MIEMPLYKSNVDDSVLVRAAKVTRQSGRELFVKLGRREEMAADYKSLTDNGQTGRVGQYLVQRESGLVAFDTVEAFEAHYSAAVP